MDVFNTLKHYSPSLPVVNIGKLKGSIFYALTLRTRALPCFTELHNLFYVKSNIHEGKEIKIVPVDIFNLLTPVALAH